MSIRLVRQLAQSAARAAVIIVMGPVILVLGGVTELTWSRALESLKFTGPLAAVMFAGFALLDWGSGHAPDARDAAPHDQPTPPTSA